MMKIRAVLIAVTACFLFGFSICQSDPVPRPPPPKPEPVAAACVHPELAQLVVKCAAERCWGCSLQYALKFCRKEISKILCPIHE